MDDPSFHQELVELLGRRGHILVSLTEWNDSEAHVLQVLGHLYCSPSVEGYRYVLIEKNSRLFRTFSGKNRLCFALYPLDFLCKYFYNQ